MFFYFFFFLFFNWKGFGENVGCRWENYRVRLCIYGPTHQPQKEQSIYDARTRQNGRRTCVRHNDAAAHMSVPRLIFFFFFSTDSRWLSSNSCQFGQNQVVSAGSQNWPKQAEIGFEWGPNILKLSFLNFILNICCFFCVFFFVLRFLPSYFFVLWTKDI